jgi:hypothetical protein
MEEKSKKIGGQLMSRRFLSTRGWIGLKGPVTPGHQGGKRNSLTNYDATDLA